MDQHGSSESTRSGPGFETRSDSKSKDELSIAQQLSLFSVAEYEFMIMIELMKKSTKFSADKKIKLEAMNRGQEGSHNLGIDYRRCKNESYAGARFVFECGIKLKLQPLTIATAAVLYHRFFSRTSIMTYDICTIGATSVFLACKVENDNCRMKDIINVVQQSIERDADLIDMDERYFNYKNGIIQAELLMMRILGFPVNYIHPHRYLVHYLREIQNWMGHEKGSENAIFRTAWSFLQDFHHDSSVIDYRPQELAIAAIQLSLYCFGVLVPGDKPNTRKSWKKVFFKDFDQQKHLMIMTSILKSYDKEMKLFNPELGHHQEAILNTPSSPTHAMIGCPQIRPD